MKHLKIFLSFALTLALCLSLAACGESNEDLATTAATIIFMACRIPSRVWSRTLNRCRTSTSSAAHGVARTAAR